MKYNILLHTPVKIYNVLDIEGLHYSAEIHIQEAEITISCIRKTNGIYKIFELTAQSMNPAKCYISVHGVGEGELYSFAGKSEQEQILRQSPHNYMNYQYKMDKSAIPSVAVVTEEGCDIWVSDNPAHCDNYTTQHIIPQNNEFFLSSGDNGGSPNFEGDEFLPYYHSIDKDIKHTFKVAMCKTKSDNQKAINRDMFVLINSVFGNNDNSVYHAMCFGANYMHYRRNEEGSSDYWIVAGIQYANSQYIRDSFYQTMILPYEMEQQCYNAYACRKDYEKISGAENPLFLIIWSYRIFKRGGQYKKELLDAMVKKMFMNIDKYGNGGYCADCREDGTFRNWFDICAYEFDDIDAYSQGLCICALYIAKELGYDVGNRLETALNAYLSLYNGKFMQMSAKKPYLALDCFIGPLLYYMLFGKSFIPDYIASNTYNFIINSNAKTKYGIKIVSDVNGDYLPQEAYRAYNKENKYMEAVKLGSYANGGSYHIYEMMFHIAAFLHHADGVVDNMTKRLFVDLDYDGATHEYTSTISGFCSKANQGWNAAIYSIWAELIERGVGDKTFFEDAEAKLRSL